MDHIRCRVCQRLHCTIHRSLPAAGTPRTVPTSQTQSAVSNSPGQTGEIPPASLATWMMRDHRDLRHRSVDYQFLLAWCLHHLRSFQAPPPSVGDDVDVALRRILRHSPVMPPQVGDTSTFVEVLEALHNLYLKTD